MTLGLSGVFRNHAAKSHSNPPCLRRHAIGFFLDVSRSGEHHVRRRQGQDSYTGVVAGIKRRSQRKTGICRENGAADCSDIANLARTPICSSLPIRSNGSQHA